MRFTDRLTIDGTRRRDDGYLVADARTARTGIQTYLGTEVGKPDQRVVRVYRPDAEVFSDASMASFAHRPVTDDHPPELVGADNWKTYAVGQTGEEVRRDGQFVRVPLMVADGNTIQRIEDGKRELSAGYTCDLDWTAGVTEDGEHFDAVQRNIRINHVATVQRGRAGSACRIGDGAAHQWGAAPITDAEKEGAVMPENLRKVVVDGISVEVTDNAASIIDKLKGERDAAREAQEDASAEHAKALADAEAKTAKVEAQLDAEKAKVMTQDQIDALVEQRSALVADAKLVASDIDAAGMSDADLRRAVVQKALGDDAIADRSEAYIDARFEILAEDAKAKAKKEKDLQSDPFAATIRTGDILKRAERDNGQAEYVKRISDAWKTTITEKEA